MHESRRVVHQSHRFVLAESGSVTAGNKADPETMTCQPPSTLFQRRVVVAVHGPVQLRKGETIVPFYGLQKGFQVGVHGDGEVFSGVPFLPFGIGNGHRGGSEVDLLLADTCLTESASEVELKLEGGRHPRLSPGHGLSDGSDLLDGDLPLLLGGSDREPRQRKAVALGVSPTDRLVHEEAEELDLVSGGVPSRLLSTGAGSPVHVVLGMTVEDLGGVLQAFLMEPHVDCAPEVGGSLLGLLIPVMLGNVLRSPVGEVLPSNRPDDSLLGRSLLRSLEGLQRGLRIIMSELKIFLTPPARPQISKADIPVGTSGVFCEVSHTSYLFHIVPHEGRRICGTNRG